jgi:hypothetical protein
MMIQYVYCSASDLNDYSKIPTSAIDIRWASIEMRIMQSLCIIILSDNQTAVVSTGMNGSRAPGHGLSAVAVEAIMTYAPVLPLKGRSASDPRIPKQAGAAPAPAPNLT